MATASQEGPQSPVEEIFADLLVSYYRRTSPVVAAALLIELADALDGGADQGDLIRIATVAVAGLPVPH